MRARYAHHLPFLLLLPGLLGVGVLGTGCGSSDADDATTSSSSTGGSTSETSSSTETSGESSSGSTIVPAGDVGPTCGSMCDIWTPNDCGEGQKCTAVACEVGSNSWDSNICREIQGSKQLGDECEYLGTGLDGNDDCDAGLMCWDRDATTGLGNCIAFCEGSEANPTCVAGTVCEISNEGALAVCLPSCDPLAQDCDGGDLCLPAFSGAGYICVLDASGGMGPYGTPCQYGNSCNVGLMCIASEGVPEPECATANTCCSPICDLNEANTCPGEGQECAPVLEPGSEPPGQENVGVCAVPTG